MTKENVLISSFNRGIISPLALARTDLKRTALSAEIQNNYIPRNLGSMMFRPGYPYIDGVLDDNPAIHIPFIFSIDDTAILEITDSVMRVRVDETIISRPSVTTTITNGTFDTNLTGWTDNDQSGADSSWVSAGILGGYMGLTGTTFNAAIRDQAVTVSAGNLNIEHGIRVVIARGPVTIKIGKTTGSDEYVKETKLNTGTYSFSITPTGNFSIRLSSLTQAQSWVDSVTIESAGEMQIPVPWGEADLPYIRWDTSGDVIFVCDGTHQQRRIERRATRSWGVGVYQPNDGPLRAPNLGTTTLTPSAISGDITLTASQPLFYPAMIGALFSIDSAGQTVSSAISGANQWSDPIRVVGVGDSRTFSFAVTGTWVGTWVIQSSIDAPGSWVNTTTTNTANASGNVTDGLDNQIVYYRIGIATGAYTSGTANVSLSFSAGSITGFARVTSYSSSTSVGAAVVKALGNTVASANWSEGEWSDYRGFPSANAFYEGRLWWAGNDKIIGSISDAFDSFDLSVEGDSGTINRSIGSGPVDSINWLLPLLRLMVGTEMSEKSARSSSLDEPLTPTNFNLKTPSTRGTSAVPPAKIDSSGIFVRLNRLFELAYAETYSVTSDYGGTDLTVLAPEVGNNRFTRVAVQRYPDTRIHCIRDDGKVAIMIFDRSEDVKCWVTVETDGEVEDVFTMPAEQGDIEDKVYYLIKRTINGSTKRFLERWSFENESAGGTTIYDSSTPATVLDAVYPDGTVVTVRDSSGTKIGNNLTVSDNTITLSSAVTYASITPSIYKLSDSHVVYSGVATTTFTAAHLPNEEVVIWGDGKDLGTFTLNGSGQVTIPSVETYCGGLAYEARYKSTKLAYAAQAGTALTQRKEVNYLGVILSNTHIGGLQYGQDFDNMDDLPLEEDGQIMDSNFIYASYDKDQFEFPGDYNTDSRVCLKSASPRPATVLACVIGMTTHEKL